LPTAILDGNLKTLMFSLRSLRPKSVKKILAPLILAFFAQTGFLIIFYQFVVMFAISMAGKKSSGRGFQSKPVAGPAIMPGHDARP
jgi:hypothetical protein